MLLFATFIRLFRLLDCKDKKALPFVLLLILVGGIVDVLGLASIVPLLYKVKNNDSFFENESLNAVYKFVNVTNINSFLIFLTITVFFLFLFKNIFSLIVRYLSLEFSFGVALKMEDKILNNTLSEVYEFLEGRKTNELVFDSSLVKSFCPKHPVSFLIGYI